MEITFRVISHYILRYSNYTSGVVSSISFLLSAVSLKSSSSVVESGSKFVRDFDAFAWIDRN